jgi:phage gp45-like
MWISDYITRNSKSSSLSERGSVKGSLDGRLQVNASSDFSRVELAAPYGIVSVPPSGEQTVVINAGGCNVCVGTLSSPESLMPGELMLSSAGGARLVLKNDGKVYVNGREI